MTSLGRFLPASLRPVARRVRNAARPSPLPATSGQSAIATDESVLPSEAVLRLLFGDRLTPEVRAEAQGRLNGQPIRDASDIRTILGAIDRQLGASPVSIRFRAVDTVRTAIDGLHLVLDGADASVSKPILHATAWEPHLTTVFRRMISPGQHVVDVGANVGYFTALAASLVGATGRVTAVEPNSENCRLILATVAANGFTNVDVIPVALDSRRGWAHFSTHVGSNGGMRGGEIDQIVDEAGLIVPTFPLDDLVDTKVHFLKIDVEGAEYRAVLGAQKIITVDRPVVSSEFSVEMIERVSGAPAIEYLSFFAQQGYDLFVIDRSDASLRPFATPADLLTWWPHTLHLEDLLFVPRN